MNNGNVNTRGDITEDVRKTVLIEGFKAASPNFQALVSLNRLIVQIDDPHVFLKSAFSPKLEEPRVEMKDGDLAKAVYDLGQLVDNRLLEKLELGTSDSFKTEQLAREAFLRHGYFGPFTRIGPYLVQTTSDCFRILFHRAIEVEANTLVCGITFQLRMNSGRRTPVHKIVE